LASRRNSTCNMTSTSHSALFVIAIVFAAFALTTGKDAVKNEDLAAQLKEARLESADLRQKSEELHQKSEELRQALEKSKEETKMIIERENKKLTGEAAKLRKENKKLRRQDKELRQQDKELRQRDAELERKVNELHQDNSEVKKAFRQRDQNNTLELQNIVRNSFRQMDFTSELKKTINIQIKEYLDDNKLCVTGDVGLYPKTAGENLKIEFGQTFQRIPTFAAALSTVYLKTADAEPQAKEAHAQVYNFRVTNSSAVVALYSKNCWYMRVNYVACL